MDFTSQLANLQRTANRASSSPAGGGGRGGNDGGRGGPRRHRRDGDGGGDGRPYHHNKRQRRGGGGRWSGGGRRGGGRGYYDDRGGGRGGGGGGGVGGHRRNNRNDGDLRRHLESLPPYRPPSAEEATGERASGRPRHVAILFLTITDLPYEHIWRAWANPRSHDDASNDDADDPSSSPSEDEPSLLVSILCHAKYPDQVRSPFLRHRLLVEPPVQGRGHDLADPVYRTHRPEWGSVEITRGMIDLLSEALRIGTDDEEDERILEDERYWTGRYLVTELGKKKPSSPSGKRTFPPPVDRFVFASETCVPVTTLEEFEVALFGPRDDDDVDQEGAVVAEEEGLEGGGKIASSLAGVADVGDGEDPQTEKGTEGPSTASEKSSNAATSTAAAQQRRSSRHDKSWVNARNTPNNGYARQLQWDQISSSVPQSCIWKADQWLVLIRSHARAISDLGRTVPGGGELWKCFRNAKASDEMYFPTVMALLGIVRVPPSSGPTSKGEVGGGGDKDKGSGDANDDERGSVVLPSGTDIGSMVLKRRVTYADWSEGAKNPASFDRGLRDFRDVARKARAEGCLFARKFRPDGGPLRGGRGGGRTPERKEGEGGGGITAEEWADVMRKLGSC